MRIGIDGRMLYHTGIGRYIQNLLTTLPREDVRVVAWLNAQGMEDARIDSPYLEKRHSDVPVFHPAEHWAIAREAHRANLDLLHAPHYNAPLFYQGKLVITLHDLIPLRCPGTMRVKAAEHYFATLVKRAARRADRIIAVSTFTRQDVLEFTGVDPAKITAVLQGVDLKYARPVPPEALRELRDRHGLTGRYLLYTGQQKPYKNVGLLIAVLERLRNQPGTRDVQLVLVGARETRSGLDERIAQAGLDDAVIRPGYIRDEDHLIALYQGASAFVFPSRYEGFGLPPLEAMAAGIPVVSSNRASLPEVVGDAGLLLGPDDVEGWAEAVTRLLADEYLRTTLIAAGHERVREFSWQRTAEATLAVYRGALGVPAR